MPLEVKVWNVRGDSLVSLEPSSLNFESRLEEWVKRDISIISSEYLVIGQQVPTAFGGYIDLLCLDADGNTVIVELKREKTPREVTAQVLDYASWVQGLSNDDIREMAQQYFGKQTTLAAEFRTRFDSEVPDVLNESHQMLIVSSEIDPATERIIQYLSDHHGVEINAVRFHYFEDSRSGSGEYLARTFLIEPEEVEYKARTRKSSKRSPALTMEQLQQQAETNGVGELFQRLMTSLTHLKSGSTRSGYRFFGDFDGRMRVVFSVLPAESSAEKGLRFQVYFKRFCEMCGLSEKEALEILPPTREEWSYGSSDPEWSGYAGYFSSAEDVARFVKGTTGKN
jgi:hypothetical protein